MGEDRLRQSACAVRRDPLGLASVFQYRRTVIIALPPFGLAPGLLRLRASLLDRGSPYFDDYFQPVVPPRRKLAAQCCWNVNDASDIQRYILAAAGHIGQERRQAARSAENPTMMLQRASVALNRFDPGHTVVGG